MNEVSAHEAGLERIPWHYGIGYVSDFRWQGTCRCGYRTKYHMSPGYAESAVNEHVRAMQKREARP